MTIDLSQFHQVFFEESFEGLEVMEQGLLNLDVGAVDDEAINTIFRAAHSIKGGAGTFGFTAVSGFTHIMETLLDQMRSHKRDVTREDVDLLLQSVDCLRGMLGATRDNAALDSDRIASMQRQLEQALNAAPQGTPAAVKAPVVAPAASGWVVNFRPHPHLMKTGNDPLRLIRELATLGDLACEVNADRLPPFTDLDPEECYLSWKLKLKDAVDRLKIGEVFDWVDGDCDLDITPLGGAPVAPPVPQVVAVGPAEATEPAPPIPHRRSSDRRQNDDRRQSVDRRTGMVGESTSIRVGIDKVDAIVNMVGELVITQSMLNRFSGDFDMAMIDQLRDGLQQLARNTRELQETVLKIRMLPISFSFNRFPRLVHDLSAKLGKKIELKMSGEQTELDKTVLEKIGDPLVHLVRNSLDHGIEMPEVRIAAGKPETGIIHLNAGHEGGNIVIEITDDGAGLNTGKILAKARERGLVAEDDELSEAEIHELIFAPGFSTADQVSDVSGRGVGMDVVRRNIKELGGNVEIQSRAGQGSTFKVRLPLTLAILDGQLVRVGDQIFIVPLISIVESLQVSRERVKSIAARTELYKLRENYLPIVRLYKLFNIGAEHEDLEHGLLVVVEADGQQAGIFVDELAAQQQVVIKSLETNFRKVDGISGATILGDGTVAMILDVPGLINMARRTVVKAESAAGLKSMA
jgi:two-component system chemotaxis sensor kinase CheA